MDENEGGGGGGGRKVGGGGNFVDEGEKEREFWMEIFPVPVLCLVSFFHVLFFISYHKVFALLSKHVKRIKNIKIGFAFLSNMLKKMFALLSNF